MRRIGALAIILIVIAAAIALVQEEARVHHALQQVWRGFKNVWRMFF